MIHFPKEGTRYKTGLNIKIFKDYFFKITLVVPVFIVRNTYTDLFGDVKYKGWRVWYFNVSYLRAWNNEDLISFRSYFQSIGKQVIISYITKGIP